MDSGSGGGRSTGPSLASYHRFVCDGDEPLVADVFCSDGGRCVGGHGRSSAMLGPSPSVCFPSIPSCSPGPQQVSGVGELRNMTSGFVVATIGVVSRPSTSGLVPSGSSSDPSRPPTTSLPSLPFQSVVAGSSRVETVRRFARAWGVSGAVARQLANCHWPSTQRLYQHHWLAYRWWCHSKGHTVLSPSVAKIADFLLFLRRDKGLSVSAVKGFRSMLTSVFKYRLPELSDHFLLQDLIRSFELKRPVRSLCPPTWDLCRILEYLQIRFSFLFI